MTVNLLASDPVTRLEAGDLIDERKAAAMLGMQRKTLQNWRALHKGPRYRKIGARMVRYHIADLVEFQRIMGGESGEAAA